MIIRTIWPNKCILKNINRNILKKNTISIYNANGENKIKGESYDYTKWSYR